MELKRIEQAVTGHRSDIIELSQSIGRNPELMFEEHESSRRVAELLSSNGFEVEHPACGLDTAVIATYGTGSLVVGIVAEYDALDGIGHGCGHNIIAASAVGAALGLKGFVDELDLTIKFLGTPAEEGGGGKVLMLREGAWDDCHLSMMIHGTFSPALGCQSMSSTGRDLVTARFTGRGAHAAYMPEAGRSAASAVTLSQVAIGLMRQHLPKGSVVSPLITEAGIRTNIIPETAELHVEVRSFDLDDRQSIMTTIENILTGCAQATETTVELTHPDIPYDPLKTDDRIGRIFDETMEQDLGIELIDLRAHPEKTPAASTDMGNVSRYLPSIHPVVALRDCSAVPHTAEFAAAAVSPAGDEAACNGALAMALTTAKVASDPGLRAELIAEQKTRAPYSEAGALGTHSHS
ncbi:amidohydrolase [Brevibacterium sanguinis]|uniref:Peptidase M20 domain-containing protein 2 n=3 Tax=Brevibacterium TaxID=1696 RepID=A0A366INX6_9MICO|nr:MULTISPECIES: M20 family metallopeptidase [Brevibacterium]RBP67815.1 amidohydrolase [Brevibacterium sanguinis]RBP74768.1 amidohydrolase [Brevibacterium celere]